MQQIESITLQLASYDNNEAHMNPVMASWIIFLRHETYKFIPSTISQVIPFDKRLCSIYSLKKLICRRVQVETDELNDMTQKWLLSLKHQVQIRLPK